ncbi:MAG: hypothetical protein Q8R86_09690 [Sulfuricurvum sp.]|nr:hypothetical protein [Sulfuricurvum sp.]
MPQYQVQLKQGSNTKVVNVEGKSVPLVLDFFNYITTMKVTEIRQVLFSASDTIIPVDDFNYDGQFRTFAKSDTNRMSRQFIFPNIKRTRNENEIFQKMKECLEIDGASIHSITASLIKGSSSL